MTFDSQKIEQSKVAYRKHLANLPLAEKLRLLDVLRERSIAVHGKTKKEKLK